MHPSDRVERRLLPGWRRRPFLTLSTLLAALGAAPAAAQSDNVLIVIADDLGVENVGVYREGPAPPPTPNIDALAGRGVLFRNAWSNPICSPTRACIQTGRYSSRTGVGTPIIYAAAPSGTSYLPSERQNVLSLEEVTLPELLDAQGTGYAHAMIGKWHLGDHTNGGMLGPNLAGWSHFAGCLAGTGYTQWPRTVDGRTSWSYAYPTTQRVDDALAWIRGTPQPWVVCLAFSNPHAPFHAPPASLHTRQLAGLDPGDQPRPFYKAMVEAVDTEIGRLLTELGPDVLARTNVIFCGDNGTPNEVVDPPPYLPSHAKGTPYEGGINVPLIVAGPAVTAPGRESDALVGLVDLFATVAELCGARPEVPLVKIDSVSFARSLRDPWAPSARQIVFAEAFSSAVTGKGVVALRDARHKLIVNSYVQPTRYELYDLTADPFETGNLLPGPLTPPQAQSFQRLRAELDAIRETTGAFAVFGASSCAGSSGVPRIGAQGVPTIGTSYTVTLANGPPASPALLLAGFSASQWLELSLPYSLASLGAGPGCFLYSSAELAFPTATGMTGDAALRIRVPAMGVLVSGSLHHAWLLLDPAAPASPLGLVASDGATARIGQ